MDALMDMDNYEPMPRYAYDKLVVSCLHSVEFAPGEMRAAVECLRNIPDERPDKSWIGLMAEAFLILDFGLRILDWRSWALSAAGKNFHETQRDRGTLA